MTMRALYGVNANLLVALDALLEERSVGRAARRMGLTQPSVSNQLARLRELFDDPLLVRVGNRMVLTPRAERLIDPVQQGVALLEDSLRPPDDFDPTTSTRTFHVVLTDLVELTVLPRVLRMLGERAPRASLQVFTGGVFEVPEELAVGGLDLMAGYFDSASLPAGYHERDLMETRLVGVVRRGHPACRGGRMSKARYLAASHVVVTERRDAAGLTDGWLAEEGVSRHIGARVTRSSLVPPIVAETDLIGAIDHRLVAASTLPLEELRVPVRLPKGTAGLLWHERLHRDPEHRFLRRLFLEAAEAA